MDELVQKHFEFMDYILRMTLKTMLARLGEGLQATHLGTFTNKDKIDFVYPAFEIFSYLLFDLDYLAQTYQEQKLGKPLFNFIADRMLETLYIEKNTFNNTLSKRMEEYGDILVDWNAGKITDDIRTKKLIEGFLINLTYSISKQALFRWEGKIKPLPPTDALKFHEMHIIYIDTLLPTETRFFKLLKNLFTVNSDFTQLSIEAIDAIATTSLQQG